MDEDRDFFPPEPLSWSWAELDGVCMGVLPIQRTNRKTLRRLRITFQFGFNQSCSGPGCGSLRQQATPLDDNGELPQQPICDMIDIK